MYVGYGWILYGDSVCYLIIITIQWICLDKLGLFTHLVYQEVFVKDDVRREFSTHRV